MKSFTDLNQSKKLAEILPLESADTCYGIDDDTLKYNDLPWLVPYHKYTAKEFYIPCWSLASLLSVIPYNVSFNKAVYRFKMVKYSEHWECYHENFGSVSTEIFKADNPVDACYRMILKLNELKML